jgi:DNA-binding GntR family transcriptional regulator
LDLLADCVVPGRIPWRWSIWGQQIKLDPLNPGVREGDPLYLQVERRIEDLLLRGLYKAGDRIPPDAMLLDLLVSEGVPVGCSQMSIGAVVAGPGDEIGQKLCLKTSSAALSLIQTIYLTSGQPAQWSRDTFLPGKLDLHVLRELFEVRNLL